MHHDHWRTFRLLIPVEVLRLSCMILGSCEPDLVRVGLGIDLFQCLRDRSQTLALQFSSAPCMRLYHWQSMQWSGMHCLVAAIVGKMDPR